MTLRNALGQAGFVTVAVLAALAWLLIAGLRVVESIDFWGIANAGVVGDAIGTTAVGGILGVAVLVITMLLAVVLLGELGEAEPAPETWPPE